MTILNLYYTFKKEEKFGVGLALFEGRVIHFMDCERQDKYSALECLAKSPEVRTALSVMQPLTLITQDEGIINSINSNPDKKEQTTAFFEKRYSLTPRDLFAFLDFLKKPVTT